MKKARYLLEYILFSIVMLICRMLPASAASSFTGTLARAIGPFLDTTSRARTHLKQSFPDMSEAEIKQTITHMWDNLGRVIGEYPHLPTITRNFVSIENTHLLEEIITSQKPCVFISAHIGNWEISGGAILAQHDIAIAPVYRAPNNPYVDRAIKKYRSLGGRMTSIPKSSQGAREMMKALRAGEHIAIIFDQKYNQGAALPFFGRDAMTSTAFADLAIKFECPVIAGQIIRTKGAAFRLVLHKLYDPVKDAGITAEALTLKANDMLEDWICENPPQWLWLHRRWPPKTTE